MKRFLPYIFFALSGFLISSFLTRGGVSFGFPLDVYGPNTCLRGDGFSYYARFFPCDAGWHWMAAVYDCIFWFVASIIFINFYKKIKNNPKSLFLYGAIAFIGFLVTSKLFNARLGYPYEIFYIPIDCGFSVPPGNCEEGFIWEAIFLDSIIWLAASFILVHLYQIIKNNFKFNFQLKNVLRKISSMGLMLGVIIGLIFLIVIIFNFLKPMIPDSTNRNPNPNLTCGGFTGALCPNGYYCSYIPRTDYGECVSWFEFMKRKYLN